MKKFLPLFLVLACLAGSRFQLLADHIVGSDITYTRIDSNHYLVTLKFYRDCNGCKLLSQPSACGTAENCNSSATAPTTLAVHGAGGSCNGTAYSSITMTRQSIADITPTCPTTVNRCMQPCNGSYPYGIEEHVFTGELDVTSIRSSGCCRVRLSLTLMSRSVIITTGQSQQSFYTDAEIDICAGNNSPVLSNRPIAIVCCNQPFYYNQGTVDTLDHDSLSFAMVAPLVNATTSATFATGLSVNTPVPVYLPGGCSQVVTTANPPVGFFVDPNTGDMIFTPASNACTPVACPWVGIICMEVKEWRKVNGQMTMVGRTRRDMQFITQNCPGNNPPTLSGPYSYTVCEGSQICFNIQARDMQFIPAPPNPAPAPDSLFLSWNMGIPGASFTTDTTTTISSSAGGAVSTRGARFCWTPPAGKGSTLPYTFTVTATDRSCPKPAYTTRGYKLFVKTLPSAQRQYTPLGCGKIRFHAVPTEVTSYSWSIYDSSNTIITSADADKSGSGKQTDTIHFKKPGKYIIWLQVNNSGNCPVMYQDTLLVDSAQVQQTPVPSFTFSVSSLPNRTFSFTPSLTGSYSYHWDFGDGSTSSQQSPTHQYAGAGNYTVCLTISNVNGCPDIVCQTIAVTSVKDLFAEQASVTIYPNPFSGEAVVEMNLKTASTIDLVMYDMLGREYVLVQDRKAAAGLFTYTINPSAIPLPKGVLVLKVTVNGAESCLKLIRMN